MNQLLLFALFSAGQSAPTSNVFAEGIVSTKEFESHLELDVDGKTLYFVRSTPQFTDWKVYVSKFDGKSWAAPSMAPFSGKYADADPFITPDGKRFFFISNRPDPAKKDESMDIWVMDRAKGGWSEPRRLGPEVNTDTDEWYPTVSRDGTLYFGSGRKGTMGGCDLWRSRQVAGKYREAENLGSSINSESDDVEPFITPDGRTLVFNSTREGGAGGLDFYVSTRKGEAWSAPRRLPQPPNSRATELAPKISRDGKRFYYTGMRRGFLGDLLWLDAKSLGLSD